MIKKKERKTKKKLPLEKESLFLNLHSCSIQALVFRKFRLLLRLDSSRTKVLNRYKRKSPASTLGYFQKVFIF
jgi:hypothetical protein